MLPMRIRTHLMVLVVATLLPAGLASVMGIVSVYRTAQSANWQSLRETSRALSMLVENEMNASQTALETLALAPTFNDADISRMQEWVQRLSAQRGGYVSVSDASGRLLASSMPADEVADHQALASLGPIPDEGGQAAVSPVYWSPQLKQLAIALRSLVRRDGKLRFVLVMEIRAAELQRLLERQQLPTAWVGTILDRNGVIVARTRDPDRFVGMTANGPIRQKLDTMAEGEHVGQSLSGEPVNAFFSRAPKSGFTFVVSVPQAQLREPALQAALLMGGALVTILGLGVLAAAMIGRRIARPIESLRLAAEQLGRSEQAQPPHSGILELDAVATEIKNASSSIRGAEAQLQRKVSEAVAEAERTQRALLQSQKLEALGRLTGGIAHDFNNVLQTLTSGLQIAQLSSSDPKVKAMLETCDRAVRRAVDLTRQLMAFGRIQEARMVTLDVGRHIRDTLPLLKGALPVHIEFELGLDDDVWAATLDPLQLELALLNLCINARDAMPAGGRLRLEVHNETLDSPPDELAPGDYVVIMLADSGQGMPQEVISQALDPFFTTKAVGAGSGLGLPQAYGFARQSGGTLLLESTPGRGTRVTIYLPRSQRALPGVDKDAAPAEAGPRARGRVLFVEDDALVREVVVASLQASGFDVTVAENGDDALQALGAQGPFDLVFSDIVMPGRINGIALAQAVQRNYPETHVVLATGYTQDRVPVDDVRVLAKPYDVQDLVHALRAEMGRTAAWRKLAG
ncbi:MAG: putative histidine kinase, hybrid [Paucimonas sp.]|nr:putative histidine kinase, hybrid [Paucimonas sp.]